MGTAGVAVFLFVGGTTAAAETGANAATALPSAPQADITVVGRALDSPIGIAGYGVTVIDLTAAEHDPAQSTERLLATIPGVQQFRRSDSRFANPSAQGLTVRALGGNASSRSLVLRDGVPVADPFFGSIPFRALDAGPLATVRITRGSGAGPFGAGAVAGVIELESAGVQPSPTAHALLIANGRGDSVLNADWAAPLSGGALSLSGSWDRGPGFWTAPSDQRTPASVRARFNAASGQARAVIPIGPSAEVQARIALFDDDRTLRFRGADSRISGQEASVRIIGRGRWQVDALAYVQARDFSNVVISATSFRRTLDQRATPSTGIGGKLELRPPTGARHQLRLGGDLRIADGRIAEDVYSATTGAITARRRAGGRTSDIGFYAEHGWRLGALTLTSGIRADRWRIASGFFEENSAAGALTTANRFAARAGWAVNGRGAAALTLSPTLTLRAAAYSGFRQPTLNELYRPFALFPVVTRANAALRNERLRGAEAGVQLDPIPGLTLSITTFDNRLRGAITNVTIGPNLRERQNIDAIHVRGLEFDVAARRGDWSLRGGLAISDPVVRASGGGGALNRLRPAQAPRLAASSTLTYAPDSGWRVSASVQHSARQFEDDLNRDTLPATTSVDAAIDAPLGRHVTLLLRADNLFDERAITRNQGGSIDLGPPRTVSIGLRISAGQRAGQIRP